MCTVSVVYSNGKIIITSNRDENINRPAIEPKRYCINDKVLVFPKDPKAGGTWYAVSEDRVIVVLLNGATEKHEVQTSYKKSRGLITLQICSAKNVLWEWVTTNLTDVEPFTLVVFFDEKLYQLRWNGNDKSLQELDVYDKHIWSSATLYTKAYREEREQWFRDFITQNPSPSPHDIFHFHTNTQEKNKEYGLIIDRNNTLRTTSITQTIVDTNRIEISYYDLLKQESKTNSFISI